MGRTSDPDRETDRPNPFLEGPRPTETVFQKTSGSENRTETELQKAVGVRGASLICAQTSTTVAAAA